MSRPGSINAGVRYLATAELHSRCPSTQEKVLRMPSDLVFLRGTVGAKKTLFTETKWEAPLRRRGDRPTRPDVYQLYAYLHRYECERANVLFPTAAGVQMRDLHARGRKTRRARWVCSLST